MEQEKITNQSASIGMVSCIFLIVGMLVFSIFFFDLDFLFSGSFPNIVFFPIFFIGIFIAIITALGAKKQRQFFSPPAIIPRPKTPMKIQITNNQQEEVSKAEKTRDIYCKYCGEKISQDSLYCPQCGTKLKY